MRANRIHENQTPMITEFLSKIESGRDLSRSEAEEIMEELLEGRLAHREIVTLLTSLRTKGESVEELVGFARAMRRHASFSVKLPLPGTSPSDFSVKLPLPGTSPSDFSAKLPLPGTSPSDHPARSGGQGAETELDALVDTCGTGGDGGSTFNVSTAAALVVAGAGVRVAKHGNRSFSSRCGSADVLEALGLNLQVPPQRAIEAIEQVGIGFLFAPAMHTAMRHAMAARREVGGRTVFNLLGPLTNPAGANTQVIGVPAPALVVKLGHALAELDVRHAFVVHGVDGIDEVSLSGETEVADVRPHSVKRYRVSPADFGVAPARCEALAGGDAATNAAIIRRVLAGEHGPQRDFVCINAAVALVAAGRAADFKEGARIAAEAIDSGAARAKLDALIAFSRS